MKFILNYRTELSIFLLVPIYALRWYRFVRYSGTDSCAMMVPFRRYYHLPAYAKKSDIYFYPGKDGLATQAKLYSADKKMQLDFDWNHTHKNKDRNGNVTETFQEGVIHVQEYVSTRYKDPKDKKWKDRFKRKSNNARLMTEAEIAKYGPIILKFNPNVKFRP